MCGSCGTRLRSGGWPCEPGIGRRVIASGTTSTNTITGSRSTGASTSQERRVATGGAAS